MANYAFNPKSNLTTKGKIESEKFFEWSRSSIYRTNYHSMRTIVKNFKKESIPAKDYAIPGYQGFIPSYNAESSFGKSY